MFYANKTGLRTALLAGAATAAAIGFAGAANAAEATIETVVVTGSHIPQAGLVSTSPLTTVSRDETKLEGTTSVETLINNLPAAIAAQSNEVSNGSDGTATLDLRGLGSNRTLVLVDGKRLPYGSPSASIAGAVDVHMIPSALVERVEVVTGGASAVYGSDAVAGVVNFIMRKDFQGIEIDGQYGFNQHSNGEANVRALESSRGFPLSPLQTVNGAVTNASFLMGINSDNGKGNVTAYFTYEHAQSVLEQLYDRSECSLGASGAFFSCGGSSTTSPPRLTALTGPSANLSRVPSASGSGTLTPYVAGTMAFNFAPFNYFQRPDERFNGGVIGHYSPNDSLDIYTSIMFMDDKSVAQIAPSGAFFGNTYNVNCNNPLLSPSEYTFFGCTGAFGSSTADTPIFVGKRLVESGGRRDNLRYTDYRAVIGVRGTVFGDWQYDVSAQYGQNVYAEEYLNDVSILHLNNAFEVVNVAGVPTCKSVVSGSDLACVPFNIFTAAAVSPAAVGYVAVPGFKEGTTGQLVVAGTLTGTIGWLQSDWATTPAAVAVGFEYRHDSLELRTDNEFNTGDLAGQGGPTHGVAGGETVKEIYGEFSMPIVQNEPFMKELSIEAAARYSYYKPGGDIFTFKYSGTWKPIEDIAFRAAYEHAVRAPNIVELFTPAGFQLAGGVNDGCGTALTYTVAQCANTNGGVALPNRGSNLLDCPASQCGILAGGNAALKPEQANTLTVGFVFTPTFFNGFNATIDYYDVKINHIIGALDFGTVLDSCARTASPTACALIHRGTLGVLYGSGAGSGFITTSNANLGFTDVSGVDVEANYAHRISTIWAWVRTVRSPRTSLAPIRPTRSRRKSSGDPTTNVQCNGRYGHSQCNRPQPTWRHKLRLTWTSTFGLDLSAQWRMVGSVKAFGSSGLADAVLPTEALFRHLGHVRPVQQC